MVNLYIIKCIYISCVVKFDIYLFRKVYVLALITRCNEKYQLIKNKQD